MAVKTLKEIRDRVKNDTRETQLTDAMVNDYINLTLNEINDPAWSFEQIAGMRGYNHNWSFNRRKHSFATVASTESYQLPRDVDKMSMARQTSTPLQLIYVPDEVFYNFIPYPTTEGNPRFYRLWEEEGVSTRLATDGTIDAVSSSTSDGSAFTVSVVGYDTNGITRSDVLTLNGTTKAAGTVTFDAGRSLRISKSGKTTGTITITTGSTTLLVMGPEERSPRFKVISLYPIPNSAITIYLEYFTRIRELTNDADTPDIDEKWMWIVRLGAMAKIYQYQPKETLFNTTQALFASGVRSMVKSDMQNIDYIPVLRSQMNRGSGVVELADNTYGLNF